MACQAEVCLVQVPVLDYKGERLNESYEIVKFLDKQFPDTPQVLKAGHPGGRVALSEVLLLMLFPTLFRGL